MHLKKGKAFSVFCIHFRMHHIWPGSGSTAAIITTVRISDCGCRMGAVFRSVSSMQRNFSRILLFSLKTMIRRQSLPRPFQKMAAGWLYPIRSPVIMEKKVPTACRLSQHRKIRPFSRLSNTDGPTIWKKSHTIVMEILSRRFLSPGIKARHHLRS